MRDDAQVVKFVQAVPVVIIATRHFSYVPGIKFDQESSYMITGNWEVAELSRNLERRSDIFAMDNDRAQRLSIATTTDH